MKFKFIIAISVIIAINFAIVIFAKTNIRHINKDVLEQAEYLSVFDREYDYKMMNEIKSFEDLKNSSNIILKVKLINDKIIAPNDIISKATVIQIMKGSGLQIGDEIQIVEPCKYLSNGSEIEVLNGYVPLQNNIEYYVFLKSTNKEHLYMFSSIEFGYMRTDHQNANIFIQKEDEKVRIKDLNRYDFVYIYRIDNDRFEYVTYNLDGSIHEIREMDTSKLIQQYTDIKKECLDEFT